MNGTQDDKTGIIWLIIGLGVLVMIVIMVVTPNSAGIDNTTATSLEAPMAPENVPNNPPDPTPTIVRP